ncbi:SBBP repeat-containing protein, partial [Desulfococcaceae bacterium HSG7]|nr:SBBP repeat-containing protein [Desulfococcaceae bacterium HSG7]
MKKAVFVLFALALLNFLTPPLYADIVDKNSRTPVVGSEKMMQFTSGGHVIGFRNDGVYFATGNHALCVAFENSSGAAPRAESASDSAGKAKNNAPPLQKVTYKNLWRDIDLSYDAPDGGIARSTYTLRPHADPNHIRLEYNTPIQVPENGTLQFIFKNGLLTESEPVAWQIIQGRKTAVSVSFKKLDRHRAGFKLGSYDTSQTLFIDPTLEWNTFMGSAGNDRGFGIATDSSGNVYVSGTSDTTWGATPINAHAGGNDAFVAKLNGSGVLQWNTFMGGSGDDKCYDIAADSSGNVYVTGYSDATWGAPKNLYAGDRDAFVAKLNGSGALQWHTFMGSSGRDYSRGITTDDSGNVYVSGESHYTTWGATPIDPHPGGFSCFVAKLNGSGDLQWNTFMGSGSVEVSNDIATDSSGNVYVIGYSYKAWGVSPKNSHAGDVDAFVAKLTPDGARLWNTFMGSTNIDEGSGIAVDSSGNIYVIGYSDKAWGVSPKNTHTGGGKHDAFVAKLTPDGARLWNTFMGSADGDFGKSLALDSSGNIFVGVSSVATWG